MDTEGGHAGDPALAGAVLACKVGGQAALGLVTEAADVSGTLCVDLEGVVSPILHVDEVASSRGR